MLRQRILTALVLFLVLATVLSVHSPWPFFVFLSLTCALAAWEWTRLTLTPSSRWPGVLAPIIFAVTLLQAYVWLSQTSTSTHAVVLSAGISVIVWLTGVSTALYRASLQRSLSSFAWTAFALVNLFATWGVLALLYLKQGVFYVVSLLALIWIADIAAFFVGRAVGRHKLAPAISPGKTREGALAGIIGVVLWVSITAQWPGSFGADLLQKWGAVLCVLLSIVLAVFSICGDLFESLLKRRAEVKDSSHLLPGHGGVYDRIDAVVAVVPLAFLLTVGSPW